MTDGQTSNCPTNGIFYQPKTPNNNPGEPTTTRHPPKPTGAPFVGRGSLVVSTMGQQRGCIIGRGTWYSSGTCATFRAKKASGSSPSHKNKASLTLILTLTGDTFTLSSRKGPCAFKNDIFTCDSKISNPVEFNVSHFLSTAEPR